MFQAFLIKYAEIGIKGKNRYIFEDTLVNHIRHSLLEVDGDFTVRKESGRIYVLTEGEFDYDETVEALKKIFGIWEICPMRQLPLTMDIETLKEYVVQYVGDVYGNPSFTFKVMTRRANKKFPMESNDINAAVGEAVLDNFPDLKVDVHTPQKLIHVEVREQINIYSEVIKGPGGLPVGTNGRAMLLLSGGIDSPVAGYMIAKRGVVIDAVYFHAPPYTSERAKQKVIDLAKLVSRFAGPIRLHIVNFTDIQLYIYDQCPHDELTIIMRRYMMKIAERLAQESKCLGLITGESIG
ncbi:MAG: tRNA 4-thiouridine(8) synthase ThiI, partial [Lachnospiraceae bacterium]|nr:tRNA 4-thiouridine(8) synthase ThiI [Lachnospiraceae bacterium]